MVLVDTNVWLAAGDRRSTRHQDCSRLLAQHAGELAAPVQVIAETSWLLLDRFGPSAQAGFLAMITTGRPTHCVAFEAQTWGGHPGIG